MLFRDDVKTSPPKKLREELKKKQAVFVLAPERMPVHPDTGKPSIPRSFTFPAVYTEYDAMSGTMVAYRYAEGATPVSAPGGGQIMKYSPRTIEFTQSGAIIINERNVDLYWWMLNHPQNGSNPNRDKSKPPIFVLEDKAEEAAQTIETQRKRVTAENKIYFTWTPEELREVAKSFGVQGVDGLSDDEIRVNLMVIMRRDPVQFLLSAQADEVSSRAKMQEALDKGVLYYDSGAASWHYLDSNAKAGKLIVAVRPGEEPMERLITFLEKTDKDGNLAYILARIQEETEEPKVFRKKAEA